MKNPQITYSEYTYIRVGACAFAQEKLYQQNAALAQEARGKGRGGGGSGGVERGERGGKGGTARGGKGSERNRVRGKNK